MRTMVYIIWLYHIHINRLNDLSSMVDVKMFPRVKVRPNNVDEDQTVFRSILTMACNVVFSLV